MTLNYDDRPFALPASKHMVVELAGEPVAKGRPRFGKGRAYTPAKSRNYETDLKWAAKLAMHGRAPFEGPLRVEVLATFSVPQSWPQNKKRDALTGMIKPTGKPDLDNVIKTLDAFNAIVWRDDAQVVSATVRKIYSERPRLRVEVESVFGEEPDSWQPLGAVVKRVVEKIGGGE